MNPNIKHEEITFIVYGDKKTVVLDTCTDPILVLGFKLTWVEHSFTNINGTPCKTQKRVYQRKTRIRPDE